MRAQSLSINLQGPCNARCPFCISALTWHPDNCGNDLLMHGLPKALQFAVFHGVDTVLITGSGEPMLARCNLDNGNTAFVVHRASFCGEPMIGGNIIQGIAKSGIPKIELQTNGTMCLNDNTLSLMKDDGLTHLSISVASHSPKRSNEIMGIVDENFDYMDLISAANRAGLLVRVSMNVVAEEWRSEDVRGDIKHDSRYALYTTDKFFAWCKKISAIGARQVTVRELGVPHKCDADGSEGVLSYTKENMKWEREYRILENIASEVEQEGKALLSLSYGPMTYDYQDLSVCIATCMTDTTNPNEIRSFILQPDGHVYHSWNYKGSVIV